MSDFSIEADTSSVAVSFQTLRQDWEDPPTFVVESGAEYSVHLEFGRGPVEAQDADALRFEDEDGEIIYRTSVSGHPPYPFFKPAIREFKATPESFIIANTEFESINAISDVNELVQSVAFALESQMKRNATAGASDRSVGTHPDHPQVQSGNLRARIVARRVK
jgi:hypothetical protein